MSRSLRVPISNQFADGGYSAHVHVGTHQQPARLILDTGSSTLAVSVSHFHAQQDTSLSGTPYAQSLRYGKGGWYGAVVKSTVSLGLSGHRAVLNNALFAIVKEAEEGCFKQADGIMGLAYQGLNHAHDMQKSLQAESEVTSTFPEIFELSPPAGSTVFNYISQHPSLTLPAYFTELESQGVVADQFAFLVHRSSIYRPQKHHLRDTMASHWKNHGLFIIGKPWLHTDLFHEPVHTVKVVDDKYYNVELESVRVGESPEFTVPRLDTAQQKRWRSNTIVDTGATIMVFPDPVYQFVVSELKKQVPGASALLAPFSAFSAEEKGVAMSELNVKEWPDIYLTFSGHNGGKEVLTLPAEAYWQEHAPATNLASFKLFTLPGWPPQSILGLPLISCYYTLFDRQDTDNGSIHFAQKARLSELLNATLKQAFSVFHNKEK